MVKKNFWDSKGQFSLDGFLYHYIVFLFLFIVTLNLGLNSILAVNIDLDAPTIQVPDSDVTLTSCSEVTDDALGIDAIFGIPGRLECFLRGTVDTVSHGFRLITFVFANLVFFFKLMSINPSIGLAGLVIFAPAIAMVLWAIIRAIAGAAS